MGASNVKAAYAHWSFLPGKPFQLLAFMALTAGDKDDPPHSWMKRESLAAALGRIVPDEDPDDPEGLAQRKAAFAMVAEHVGVLVRHGAITLVRRARTGRTAEYRLNLKRELIDEARADRSGENPKQSTRKNRNQSAPSATKNPEPPDGKTPSTGSGNTGEEGQGNPDPKEEKQDLHQDFPDDTRARSATTVTDARDRCPKCDGRVTVKGGRHCVAGCGWSEAEA